MRAPLRPLVRGVVVAALLVAPSVARADEEFVAARADYEAAAAAYDRQDYVTAATRFAAADDRVPNSRALQLAMTSAMFGSDAALAMELVDRADARAVDGRLVELATRLRRRFKNEAARVKVVCPASVRCLARTEGGREIDAARTFWVMPGKHSVSVRAASGAAIDREYVAIAGTTVEVPFAASELFVSTPAAAPVLPAPPSKEPEAPKPKKEGASGLRPVFFWTGLTLTAVAAGAATWLTVEATHRHDDFIASPTAATAGAGDASQTRAWVAWGATGALAVSTLVVALLTDFRGRTTSQGKIGTPTVAVAVGETSSLVVAGLFR